MDYEKFMHEALVEAKKGDLPYGAVIVKDNKIVIRGYNTAQTDNDVSAHGEINALRAFTQKYGYSLNALSGYTLYTTCEPCPMCAAACVWAGVSKVVFGASTEQLINLGTKQIDLACKTVAEKGFQNIEVIGGVLADECLELFKQL
ncbi:CMP/dCMP deaminase zinc-binding protein [Hyella patelloides LEGE 07179]|uniref:CMP/dCMP deaminase zinc-binding protein n=1 Tax=Hyella patelloides LEGE 07179 TaxID=945734 RepID=A0A563VRJ4_9CYAN|nr:nucleoside deaminase [Hyella patelloides]VEP13897.1 CMP/dCMP deaminase zinc-binding protein [Hyella patelloides LEGE 07179]